jgi:hypothetical protein
MLNTAVLPFPSPQVDADVDLVVHRASLQESLRLGGAGGAILSV